VTGANGGKSRPASAVDRLRNVHVAIMADDTDMVCDAICDCCQQGLHYLHIIIKRFAGLLIELPSKFSLTNES